MVLVPIGFCRVGTPYWMAPELLCGEPATPASDVYAFGIVLFEIFSRMSPYAGSAIGRFWLDAVRHKSVNCSDHLQFGLCTARLSILCTDASQFLC